jgi:chromosome segregation ATPase
MVKVKPNGTKKKESLLNEAIRQLETELEKLRKRKRTYENELSLLNKQIITTHSKENKLRMQLETLVEKENRLSSKRDIQKERLISLRERLAKLTKVDEEMRDTE